MDSTCTVKPPILLRNIRGLCEDGNIHIRIGMSDMNDREDIIKVELWTGDDTEHSFMTHAQMHPDADVMECLRVVLRQATVMRGKS